MEAKQAVVETLILPLGLYGCEASPLAERDTKLSISIARAIAPYSQHSFNALACIAAKKGKDYSITYAVLYRSLAMLRRMLVKHPSIISSIKVTYQE